MIVFFLLILVYLFKPGSGFISFVHFLLFIWYSEGKQLPGRFTCFIYFRSQVRSLPNEVQG